MADSTFQGVDVMNMNLLNERLQLTLAFSKRYQMSAAVCYLRLHLPLELSSFKDYEWEKVLANKVVNRLKGCIRDLDTVIRVKRTDFVIVLANITEHECKVICERIIGSITNTFTINSRHFYISCNMGISMYPYASENAEELHSTAKAEMYVSEELGENHYSYFNGKLNNGAYRKVLIENDLRYALEKDQLHVQYQPQYSLKSKRIEGFESLIRWNHPTLGEVAPTEFISFAEESGYLNSMFFWLFEEVCRNISADGYRKVKYSINLSVNQLLLKHLLEELTAILNRYHVSAEQITLEITENIEIYSVKKVNETLHELKKMGFTIALDDFGNGYFSFSHFISLPIDYIKLDRDFVTSLLKNKQHKSVIKPIIIMAHNLGLEVIIEGIEDHLQFAEWASMDCDIIQGYFISKPASFVQMFESLDEIEERVNSTGE